jgi:hypothetical protein
VEVVSLVWAEVEEMLPGQMNSHRITSLGVRGPGPLMLPGISFRDGRRTLEHRAWVKYVKRAKWPPLSRPPGEVTPKFFDLPQ